MPTIFSTLITDEKCIKKTLQLYFFDFKIMYFIQILNEAVTITSRQERLVSGYRHTTISLICMSAHKASATRCHLDHQATSGQPTIQALPCPKRVLHYRDYQLPDHLYSLRENFNKRHTPM